MEEQKIIEQRKEELITFFKTKYNYIVYALLALLVYFSIWLRTLPMKINPQTGKPGLWDITTDNWTLGPDLDPFLFLRWAKDIVANGVLVHIDTVRYAPIGFETDLEVLLHPYLIAWFHNILSFLGLSSSVDYSTIIYPVFMFALTIIFFFFFVREVFINNLGEKYSNIIGLVSSFFLIIIPSLLPRTIAGIPEKEASGLFFLFLSFYLFLKAWKAVSLRNKIILSFFSGVSTAGMAGVWGGSIFIFLSISLAIFIAFVINQIDKGRLIVSWIWMLVSFLVMSLISVRYSISNLLNSTTILLELGILIFAGLHLLISKINIGFIERLKKHKYLEKLPSPVFSILLFLILGSILFFILVLTGFLEINYIYDKIADITKPLIEPIFTRLGVTVAENRQPYFNEISGSFGPIVKNIPLFFWVFFFGSIYLYYHMIRVFDRKEKIIMTAGYSFFIFALIFSKYSSTSLLNGTNAISILLYLFGALSLVISFGYGYYQMHIKGETHKLNEIDFGLIIVFSFFFFSLVSARSAIRFVMMLAPPAAIIAGYFIVSSFKDAFNNKNEEMKNMMIFLFVILAFLLLYSSVAFYNETKSTSKNYVPSIYTQQWQLAMSWVRNNTSENAVFGHWWDYGYWVQSIGERATVTDGGNQYEYWNYLMGRYALTGQSYQEALPFLYAHNTTHFLIDSTDIGKYGAFSSIGSNENYDRASFIGTFSLSPQNTQENKNSTTYVYQGGVPIDEDIFYNDGNKTIMLPASKAGLGAIFVERSSDGKLIKSPIGVFVYQNKQYYIPFKYAYIDGKFYEFKEGIRSGIYLFPAIIVNNQGASVSQNAVALYLSNRTVMTNLARLYLYNEKNNYFKLVHSEDDFLVSQLKSQGALRQDQDIVYYQGLRGPIRIWEISYPKNMEYDTIYTQTTFPDDRLRINDAR